MPQSNERRRQLYANNHEKYLVQSRKYRQEHKLELSVKKHDYYLKTQESTKERMRRNYYKNPQKHNEQCQEYYDKNKDAILKQHNDYLETHRPEMEKAWREYAMNTKDKRLQDKITVLTHYGNGKCACVKCGYSDLRALSIDHINGGGRKHNEEIKERIYDWLIKNNFPDGYQTLCMNDQWIKRAENNELAHRGRGKNNKYDSKIAT